MPRDDGEGYDYKESDQERRRRTLLKTEYENRLEIEKQRRINNPTDLEQIEDVLYDMLLIIEENMSEEIQMNKIIKQIDSRSSWNIVTRSVAESRNSSFILLLSRFLHHLFIHSFIYSQQFLILYITSFSIYIYIFHSNLDVFLYKYCIFYSIKL